jgi:hypothetical protein
MGWMLAEDADKGESHSADQGRRHGNNSVATHLHPPAFPLEGQCMNASDVASRWTVRRALAWAAVLVLGLAAGLWLRYGVIQPEDMGILCGQPDAPGWCTPRQWLIVAQTWFVWGWVALVSGAIALVIPLPAPLLRLALAVAVWFSALALILYNTTLGAVGMVLTLLALLRR